jgi:hypothetical protein
VTARGVAVIPVIAPSREQQLERELADLYAQLELKQAQLEDAHAQLAANGAPALPDQVPMCVGGGLVGEADGWLWLMRGGVLRRLWPATAEETKQASALRDQLAREQAERDAIRRRHAS